MTLAAPPKPPAHHKKRTGQHQHRQKHFAKTYWPYLPMVTVVALSIVVSAVWSQHSSVLGVQSDLSNSSLLSDSNAARGANNDQALTDNAQLDAAAQAKASDMVAGNYWSHDAPGGKTPWDFLAAAGYTYQRAGENLAYGFSSASDTITAWLNSPEHRANLLSTDYTQVGFGVASSPNYQGSGPETIVVAMYGEPAATTVAVATTVAPHTAVKGAVAPVKTVSRIQLLSNGANWTLFAVSSLAAIGLIAILLQHGRAWHRVLARSELFVIQHPLVDVVAVVAVGAAFVLTRAAGFIG